MPKAISDKPYFQGDSIILLDKGWKQAKQLKPGDKVFTQYGGVKVKNKGPSDTKKTITIDTQFGCMECSPLCQLGIYPKGKFSTIKWKAAEVLKAGDVLCFNATPTPGTKTKLPGLGRGKRVPNLSVDIAYLLGYLQPVFSWGKAQGSSIVLKLESALDVEYLERVLKEFKVTPEVTEAGLVCNSSGDNLSYDVSSLRITDSKFLSWCKGLFYEVFPDFIKEGKKETRGAFLQGMINKNSPYEAAIYTPTLTEAEEVLGAFQSLGIRTRLIKLSQGSCKICVDPTRGCDGDILIHQYYGNEVVTENISPIEVLDTEISSAGSAFFVDLDNTHHLYCDGILASTVGT